MIYEKLVNDVFDNVKNILLNDIPLEYQNDIVNNYKKKLFEVYSKLDVNKNYELIKEALIELEVSKWENTSSSIRLSEFVSDKAMEDIRYISSNGYKCAEERIKQTVTGDNTALLKPTIDINKAEEAILMLEKLLPQVKEFNTDLAKYYVSEGILDFEYASGKIDSMSFRICGITR